MAFYSVRCKDLIWPKQVFGVIGTLKVADLTKDLQVLQVVVVASMLVDQTSCQDIQIDFMDSFPIFQFFQI